MAVGGGSGGHVTPVVAVLRELKSAKPNGELRFWCDNKFLPQARGIMNQFDESIQVEPILSGKLRRYNNLPLWRQLLRPVSIVLPNIRDGFLVLCGFIQSAIKLWVWRPDVIFTKGGYVCLPVGLAARMLGIPLVIHDSDAHPGLTNRVLAKWATSIATGAPLKYYSYPTDISRYVGIPIREGFRKYSDAERRIIKAKLGFSSDIPLTVITGGGLGAKRINDAVISQARSLIEFTSVMLISGKEQYDELRALAPQGAQRFDLRDFVSSGMEDVLGAADVVVTRAGATTMLELAALAKPTIVIPNGFLTGGHQLKNAEAYAENKSIEVIDDQELNDDHTIITTVLRKLLNNPARLNQMGKLLHEFAKPDAAKDVAAMILRAAKKK